MKRNLFTWGTIAVLFLSVIVACNKKPAGAPPSARVSPAPVVVPDSRTFVELVGLDYAFSLKLVGLRYGKVNELEPKFAGKIYVVSDGGKYFLEFSNQPVVKNVLPPVSSRVFRFELALDKPDYKKNFSADIINNTVVIGTLKRHQLASFVTLCDNEIPSNPQTFNQYCAIQYPSKDQVISINFFPNAPIHFAFDKNCKSGSGPRRLMMGNESQTTVCSDVKNTEKLLSAHDEFVAKIYAVVVDDSNPDTYKREIVERWMKESTEGWATIVSIKSEINSWKSESHSQADDKFHAAIADANAKLNKMHMKLRHIRQDIDENGKFAKQYAWDMIYKPWIDQTKADAVAKLEELKVYIIKMFTPKPTPKPLIRRTGLQAREQLDMPR